MVAAFRFFSGPSAALRVLVLTVAALVALAGGARAEVMAFKQAVAEAAARDTVLSEFYRTRNYEPLWTSGRDRGRRQALIKALDTAGDHGLPETRYKRDALEEMFRAAKSPRDRGRVEVEASRVFLQFAQDLQSGVLDPAQITRDIKRKPPRRDRLKQLVAFSKSSPRAYFRQLAPKTPEYNRLMAEKLNLEKQLGRGGWGAPVQAKSLKPGQSGGAVVQLRDRLIAMGYMKRSATQTYDGNLQKAVQQFQLAHGLSPDGVAGAGTMAEINQPVDKRLGQVIVAMERERWMNTDRGKRHVLVNITDFHAQIVDNGKVTFRTRSVVGKNADEQRTPEFSDVMEHMIINPTWNVPRSIATKEYLPLLKRNPNAVRHLRLVDARGRTVSRSAVNFNQYTERTFPFNLKEPPSQGNALGLVKFMFPNPYNIYLHDTPSKSLFGREVRAFSHGCVRLNDPFDFAYALLSKQESDPQGFFQARLKTGKETQVNLAQPLPVHIIYRTAFTQAKGRTQFRRDVYGRDARIFNALSKAGVVLRSVRG
ncbi:L,D-transpeptidase family protein [Actibacterium ureilyticum]|uniref:L,D-transpeptidase family protein n=1 Tax=Actibacterium ureilyticum TaxID=1590614 RepID=UPI000BAB1E31|nr:L,D-transpeptidase family protein [Actibacterium ureilyticum]